MFAHQIAKLNDLDKDLDEVQHLIDVVRAAYPEDGQLQYILDLQQTEIDEERKMIARTRNVLQNPN